jgi:RNA polymerase sigma-54 factor
LQDIAGLTNLHESTISRVTSGKYIETHRGVFELKHFFSHEIQSEDGTLHATAAIKAMIKKLIGEESPLNPLSDEQIRKILLERNMPLSRRTISKYREVLHIQSSAKRYKDHFRIEM